MQARGVRDILAVDLSPAMLQGLRDKAPPPGTLGNDTGVRTWQGDIVDLPAYQGPASAIFFNAVFGNLHDQREALLAASLLLSPGGYVVISHPLGREWLAGLHRSNPEQVPHELPDRQRLKDMTRDLPLVGVSFLDTAHLYIACLQVPPGYRHPAAPIYLDGDVTTGFGRGSKQMGVPTANLPPAPLAEKLKHLPSGVYFGWAQLQRTDSNRQRPAADFGVQKMVMNVGVRPTLEDAGGLTVEVHALHSYSADFYGEPMRVVALGYLRPEMRFSGIQALISRIRADIGVAKAQLDTPDLAAFASDAYFAKA